MPDGVRGHFNAGIGQRGRQLRTAWTELMKGYGSKHPELNDDIVRMQKRELPDGWDADVPSFPADPKGLATRDSSGKVLNAIARKTPWLIEARQIYRRPPRPISPSKLPEICEAEKYGGRNLHFGIREHAWARS